jgi:hypothetical protein
MHRQLDIHERLIINDHSANVATKKGRGSRRAP